MTQALRAPLLGLVLLFAAPALSGCGFRPLYATDASGAPLVGPVSVGEIEGKSGHILRTELDRLLNLERASGTARSLDVKLEEQIAPLGFRPNESATRADLTLLATYKLRGATGADDLTGVAKSVVSYDIPLSAFGEIAAQNDARERAAEMLAARIQADIAGKLARARAR